MNKWNYKVLFIVEALLCLTMAGLWAYFWINV